MENKENYASPDLENKNAVKEGAVALAVNPTGLGVRGALVDVDTNVQDQPNVNPGVVATEPVVYKKRVQKRTLKSQYDHIKSTGASLRKATPKYAAGVTRVALEDKPGVSLIKKKLPPNKVPAPQPQGCVTIKDDVLGNIQLTDVNIGDNSIAGPVVPADIEDIDSRAVNQFEKLTQTYSKDIFKYLRNLDDENKIEMNHLKNQTTITPLHRSKLINWLVIVSQIFSMISETLQLAVGLIDRYLQAEPNMPIKDFKIFGMSCIYIASKYEELGPPSDDDFIVYLSGYCAADLWAWELKILTKIGFSLSKPTPATFLNRFLKAGKGTQKHYRLAKYFVELCLVEYQMAHYKSSELAAAATCLSFYLINNKSLAEVWTPTLEYYTEYSLKDLKQIIGRVATIVVMAPRSKHQAVYQKYLDMEVASLPQLTGGRINNLASSNCSK